MPNNVIGGLQIVVKAIAPDLKVSNQWESASSTGCLIVSSKLNSQLTNCDRSDEVNVGDVYNGLRLRTSDDEVNVSDVYDGLRLRTFDDGVDVGDVTAPRRRVSTQVSYLLS
ncbi:hypothetical protein IQ243_00140 [Nostocales cyanobacterium LEGE 11386]|nr:hypothetical protein [Nostocales cyanobacterium LEGE 11386]